MLIKFLLIFTIISLVLRFPLFDEIATMPVEEECILLAMSYLSIQDAELDGSGVREEQLANVGFQDESVRTVKVIWTQDKLLITQVSRSMSTILWGGQFLKDQPIS